MNTVIRIEVNQADERYTFWFNDANTGELACENTIGWESAVELMNIWRKAAKEQGINLKFEKGV